jgi:hypothetical protein
VKGGLIEHRDGEEREMERKMERSLEHLNFSKNAKKAFLSFRNVA